MSIFLFSAIICFMSKIILSISFAIDNDGKTKKHKINEFLLDS